MSESCPQCKSEKTEYRGLFEGWACDWCNNEWVDLSADEISETVTEGDAFRVDGFSNPLTVSRVSRWKVYLDGHLGDAG